MAPTNEFCPSVGRMKTRHVNRWIAKEETQMV